jgi:hypothetical protein
LWRTKFDTFKIIPSEILHPTWSPYRKRKTNGFNDCSMSYRQKQFLFDRLELSEWSSWRFPSFLPFIFSTTTGAELSQTYGIFTPLSIKFYLIAMYIHTNPKRNHIGIDSHNSIMLCWHFLSHSVLTPVTKYTLTWGRGKHHFGKI